MKNKKIKCDIYTRVSTTMQVDGYSLDAQKEKLKRYAEFQNMEIVNEYSDEGKSGKSVEGRPEFQRMLDNIENGTDEVQFVLVFKLSRFGRNAADVLNSLQRMQDFGVNLICVEDGAPATPTPSRTPWQSSSVRAIRACCARASPWAVRAAASLMTRPSSSRS